MKKAKFKVSFPNDLLLTEGKKSILLISVGQPYHESQYLQAQINLINESNFSSCDIVVADTLQRHNYIPRYGIDIANKLSSDNGASWINRNNLIIEKLNIKHNIITWDFWLKHRLYEANKKEIDISYLTDLSYQASINNTVNNFLLRTGKRIENVEVNVKLNMEISDFNSCLEYVKEECAIIMPMWAELDYDFIIYPKVMTEAMQASYEKFVKNFSPKAKWLPLRFK